MAIDCATTRNLEPAVSLSTRNDKEILFGIRNKMLTPMGSKRSRSNILQPHEQVIHQHAVGQRTRADSV
ncbi:MAG: hypothetical protein J3Q66DRAFT_350672 [Benniella sp.]|nr:MAG: hypothetical protein J3Q66DRAFT_350672 [Benniella sp.]